MLSRSAYLTEALPSPLTSSHDMHTYQQVHVAPITTTAGLSVPLAPSCGRLHGGPKSTTQLLGHSYNWHFNHKTPIQFELLLKDASEALQQHHQKAEAVQIAQDATRSRTPNVPPHIDQQFLHVTLHDPQEQREQRTVNKPTSPTTNIPVTPQFDLSSQ